MLSVIGKKLGYGYTFVISVMIIAILIGIILMNNAVNFLKLVAEDKLGAAISTMDVRINRAERNLSLKEIILHGDDQQYLQYKEDEFSKYQKKMFNSITNAVKSLNSPAFSDSIKDMFVDFYDEIHDNDQGKYIKSTFKNKGELAAIKEIREYRDKSNEIMLKLVDTLEKQAIQETYSARRKEALGANLFVLLLIFAVIISSIFSYILIKGITKSVRFFHTSAVKIYAGDLDKSIELNEDNEFHELATAFDRMRISLVRAQKYIKKTDKV